MGSDKSQSINCKNINCAKAVLESKNKSMLVYIVPHRTSVSLAEGLCNMTPLIWWRETEANPVQVTFHYCCLHWPDFTRKQRKSQHFSDLSWSPYCSVLVISQRTYAAFIPYLKAKHPHWCVKRKMIDSFFLCLISELGFIYLASIK